jgi:hypothetical protein
VDVDTKKHSSSALFFPPLQWCRVGYKSRAKKNAEKKNDEKVGKNFISFLSEQL